MSWTPSQGGSSTDKRLKELKAEFDALSRELSADMRRKPFDRRHGGQGGAQRCPEKHATSIVAGWVPRSDLNRP